MAATTWENVLIIAPQLANAASLQSNTAQALILADAAAQIGPIWGNRAELGQRYLAAHLATLSLRRGASGQISDVGGGPAKISYAKASQDESSAGAALDLTSYGVEYKRLRNQLPAARFAVAAPWCG